MRALIFFLSFVSLLSCKIQTNTQQIPKSTIQSDVFHSDFILAFGSGNRQDRPNPFWNQLRTQKPDVWVWEGDNIYCDTEDMAVLKKCYDAQKSNPDYQKFKTQIEVIGTWDDHDYGVNDGGVEYPQKVASQELLLDFLDVPKSDIRRKRKGVYFSKDYKIDGKIIKLILLDTRYFRTKLTRDTETKKRYKPNNYGEGTMLGEKQWQWLKEELQQSQADFNVIMSSIQFLSGKHGFESWGTMPHEVDKMEEIILESKAKGVFILSGDRHISEVSRKNIGGHLYPLYDFTSSGLTHSYSRFSGEENPYRVSPVVFQKSYGMVRFDLTNNKVCFEMWGEHNKLLEKYEVKF